MIFVARYLRNIYYPTSCTRTTPYVNAPEVDRALSLIYQRYPDNQDVLYRAIRNCVKVQYRAFKEVGQTQEGEFDIKESNPNRLLIVIDEYYSQRDDLSIAFLLSHELTHARQYENTVALGQPMMGVIPAEVGAYRNQLIFWAFLNDSEKDMVEKQATLSSPEPQMRIWAKLLQIAKETSAVCSNTTDDNCYVPELNKRLELFVRDLGY